MSNYPNSVHQFFASNPAAPVAPIVSAASKGEDAAPKERAIARHIGLFFGIFLALEVTLQRGSVKSENLGLMKVLLVIMLLITIPCK